MCAHRVRKWKTVSATQVAKQVQTHVTTCSSSPILASPPEKPRDDKPQTRNGVFSQRGVAPRLNPYTTVARSIPTRTETSLALRFPGGKGQARIFFLAQPLIAKSTASRRQSADHIGALRAKAPATAQRKNGGWRNASQAADLDGHRTRRQDGIQPRWCAQGIEPAEGVHKTGQFKPARDPHGAVVQRSERASQAGVCARGRRRGRAFHKGTQATGRCRQERVEGFRDVPTASTPSQMLPAEGGKYTS